MQELGLAHGLRWCSDVYNNGIIGSVSPARNREQVRSRCYGGVPNIQRRSKDGEEQSTATSSSTVDLPDDLELPGGCFLSARRRRAPAGEREVERGKMRGRGEFQRGCRLLTTGVSPVYGAPHRKPLAIAGGALGRHCALSAGVCLISSVAVQLGRNTSRFSRDTV
jgi:hypothetical protein